MLIYIEFPAIFLKNVKVLPTGSVFQKQGWGYRVGKGFHFQLFQKQCGEAYRSRYTYFSNLVARTVAL